MEKIRRVKKEISTRIYKWSSHYVAGIFTFNVLLMLMVLLRSAGYFDPFFPLTIDLIFFVSIIFSVVLIGIRSRGIFVLALVFLILALFFRSVTINVWAERANIYFFQSLFVGSFLLFFDKK